jgi:hypothetical protein
LLRLQSGDQLRLIQNFAALIQESGAYSIRVKCLVTDIASHTVRVLNPDEITETLYVLSGKKVVSTVH